MRHCAPVRIIQRTKNRELCNSFLVRSDFSPVKFIWIKRFVYIIKVINQVIRRRRGWNVGFGRRAFPLEPSLPFLLLFTVFADMPGVTFAAEFFICPLTATHPAVVTRLLLLACYLIITPNPDSATGYPRPRLARPLLLHPAWPETGLRTIRAAGDL